MKDINCYFILSYLKKVEKLNPIYKDLFVDLLVTELAEKYLVKQQAEKILDQLKSELIDDAEDYYGNKDYADDDEDYEDYYGNKEYEDDDEEDDEDIKDVIQYNW